LTYEEKKYHAWYCADVGRHDDFAGSE